jgi:hypothetical protein
MARLFDVQQIATPSGEEFLSATQGGARPVVITGEIESWKAWRLWGLDYFSRTFGPRRFKVAISQDGVFRGDPVHGFERLPAKYLTFSELSNLLSSREAMKYYMNQHPIEHGLTLIADDIVPPRFAGVARYDATNFWIGAAGNVSPMHFDQANNFLCQVMGEKVITLFSPEDDKFLYPYPKDSKISHFSMIDVEAPDLEEFPEYIHANPIRVTLKSGEMMYIPRRWWHHIRTLRNSISVNFFWLVSAAGSAT